MIQLPPSEYLGHTLMAYDLHLASGLQRFALTPQAAQDFMTRWGEQSIRPVGLVDGFGSNPDEDRRICLEWLAQYGHLKEIAVDTETTGLKRHPGGSRVVFWSMSDGHRRWTIPARNLPYFVDFLSDPSRTIIFHNANFDTHMLRNSGVDILARTPRWLARRHCTMIGHALVVDDDPHDLKFAGPDLICTWNGYPRFDMPDFKTVFGKDATEDRTGEILQEAIQDPLKFAKACDYASQDAWVTMRLYWEERRLLQQWVLPPSYGDLIWADPHGQYTLWDYFCQFEMQMLRVCYEMELEGVPINRKKLEALEEPLKKEVARLRGELNGLVGMAINPNSPRDLRWVFFGKETPVNPPRNKEARRRYEKSPFYVRQEIAQPDGSVFEQWYIRAGRFQLEPKKKTKGGKRGLQDDSTDKTVLEELSIHSYRDELGVEHLSPAAQVANLVLQIRQLDKVRSTNVRGVLDQLTPAGRCHTTFNQQVARTGRLSSSDPNLQNVQARGTYGPLIRDTFEAPPGYYMVCPDYSQIEPRCTAAFSEDPNLVQAIRDNLDVHSVTASLMYELPYDWVNGAKLIDDKELRRADGSLVTDIHEIFPDCPFTTKELLKKRKDAKQIRLGLTYGMGAKKLAARERLNCTIDAAKEQIKRFWSVSQRVRAFFDEQVVIAEETGLVFTLLGRKRNNAGVNSAEHGARGEGERIASNTPIQGCIPASVRVLTAYGYLPIGSAPEQGWTWTGSSWARYQRVARGPWERAELELTNGQVLPCDTRHKVLVEGPDGYTFRDYNDLQPGDRVCLSLAALHEFGTKDLGADEAYWMGYAVGNGSTGKHAREHANALTITIGTRKGRYQEGDKVAELLQWARAQGYNPRPDKQKPGCTSVTIEAATLRARWEALGYPWQHNAPSKHLPGVIWSCPPAVRVAFCCGLLDADGTIGAAEVGGDGGAGLHLCQRNMLQEMLILLRTCGVEAVLRGPYGQTKSWRLDINRGQARQHLGYGTGSRTNVQMPAPRFLIEQFLRAFPLDRFVAARGSERTLLHRLRRGGTTSVYTLQRLCRSAQIDIGPIYATYVLREKRALGFQEETYTLALVDPLHRFDSEGVISKNSAGEVVKMAQIRLLHDDELWNAGVRQVLQVHDEVLFLVPNHVPFEWVGPKIQGIMEHPFTREPLLMSDGTYIPLHAKPKQGHTWMEAK